MTLSKKDFLSISSKLSASLQELDARKLLKRQQQAEEPQTRSWVEATFHKRECAKFIPNPRDESRCGCGRKLEHHRQIHSSPIGPNDVWLPQKHTSSHSTDAYGTLEFQGGPHPTRAQYIRCSYDTKPEHLMQLLTREWNLELPKLLISIQGGKANFELQPKLKNVLRKGLIKAARSTNAWIFTGGTNTGVTRHIGDALSGERSKRTGRVIALGIAPWGIVENNQELIGINKDVPYHSISSPRSKFAPLNSRHTYFLLVDNGSFGKYGAEIVLRRKLEKFISNQRLYPFTHSIPIVCVVIEGGTNTIRAVLEYVTDDPPVPVVVCDGSGRAADLIAFMHKYEQSTLDNMKDYIISTIQKVFEVNEDVAEILFQELILCTRNKNLITVFRISEKNDLKPQELDQTILTVLFKSQHLTPTEQLSLALAWNRTDIARSEIFIYGQEWPDGALEDAMMQALEHDRCDFVKLLLEHGVSMKKFLTIPRLENLYNTKQGPSNTLGYILRDVRPHIPKGYIYTLHDIGLVINKLMGGAYRAFYTRRKFRPIYAKVMNKTQHMQHNSTSFVRNYGNAMSLLAQALPSGANPCLFDFPFNELLIWAVLMKRQKMALLMWQHGEEALAKALVGCKLYKALAHEAAEDDMETEVYDELRSYGKEFENIALELLDYCYRQDDDQTQQLLTCELQNWSGQTCLSLAVAANHRALLAHPCSQIMLADLWMGGLRTRKQTNFKVIMSLLFPPYILKLEFKSKEELQLMPQTTEEHMELENDDDDKSDSEKAMDAEKRSRGLSIRHKSSSPQGSKALLSENYIPRDTIVQENGKVLPDSEDSKYHYSFDDRAYPEKTKSRPLKVKKKLYEFYTAPITKFWANSISYLIFLIIFSYTVLVKMESTPSWQECFAIVYICSLGSEKIREIVSSEPVTVSQKILVWTYNMWNVCDAVAVIFFLIGVSLRFKPNTMEVGRVIYCVVSIYWYLRILNIVGVNKYLGPLVTMMGKMVKNMIYFVLLLLVVLMSFGVSRQAILFPNQEPKWTIARDVFFEPYFMLYGEVYADKIDPPCGEGTDTPCITGRWVTPAVMSIYLLIANILLINLLIAVFNNIFNEVNAVSHQVWMFQRFTVVMEYEQKPILPPPFIIICHVFLLFKYLKRKLNHKEESYDNGLKLFLERDEMDRLYDFEEDCVDGYFAERDYKLQQSSEERIRLTHDRVESVTQKVEDINSKENLQSSTIQSMDFRIRKLSEQTQSLLGHLAVIHRLIASQSNMILPPLTLPTERLRTTSEKSETASEDGHLTVQAVRRRPIVRSLTEVRPDAYIFDDGLHIEVEPVEEEDDRCSEHLDVISNLGSRKHLHILDQRTRSTDSRTSVESGDNPPEPDVYPGDDIAALSIDALRNRANRRDSVGTGRRSSEGDEVSHESKPTLSRRQFSQTQSEPEFSDTQPSGPLPVRAVTVERSVTFAEPKIKVIPPATTIAVAQSSPRAMLMAMHAEYTSITDELESYCGLLSPPRSPGLLSPPRPGQSPTLQSQRRRNASEMSNPEMALVMEKEHLRNAEESDYMVMENLIQRRYNDDQPESGAGLLSVVSEKREFRLNSWPARTLRRASAIEGDIPTSTVANRDMHHQESTDSNASDGVPLLMQSMPPRPSIVIDSSQLPIQKETPKKEGSKESLHMQSETMC